jgi:ribulose-bisphosphate carboxylase small chain
VNIEFTDDPHPRNTYWEMWGLPMYDLKDPAGVMMELSKCRRRLCPSAISGCLRFDSAMAGSRCGSPSSLTGPKVEPGFRLERQEAKGRQQRYVTHPYATDRPEGERYGS